MESYFQTAARWEKPWVHPKHHAAKFPDRRFYSRCLFVITKALRISAQHPIRFNFESNAEEAQAISDAIAREEKRMNLEEEEHLERQGVQMRDSNFRIDVARSSVFMASSDHDIIISEVT